MEEVEWLVIDGDVLLRMLLPTLSLIHHLHLLTISNEHRLNKLLVDANDDFQSPRLDPRLRIGRPRHHDSACERNATKLEMEKMKCSARLEKPEMKM